MSEPILNVVLVEPEIAYNTGSVGRTCVALGAKLWLVRPFGFTIEDRHIRRAGLDYWRHLEWEAVDDFAALAGRLAGRTTWLLSTRGATPYTDVRFGRGDVLVFGSESRGLPRKLIETHPGRSLRIPIDPLARSLNLSVSVAVVAFEAKRQIE